MKFIILTGRLTADPELRTVGEHKSKIANFRLANNDSDKDHGEFFDVHCWDKLAEFAEGYLKKGSRVLIQGSFHNEQYKDSEGNNRTHFSITATRIEFAGGH